MSQLDSFDAEKAHELKNLMGRDFEVIETSKGYVVEYVNYTAPISTLVGETANDAVLRMIDYLKSKNNDQKS